MGYLTVLHVRLGAKIANLHAKNSNSFRNRLIRLLGKGHQYVKTSNTQIFPTSSLNTTNMPPKPLKIKEAIAKASKAIDRDPKLKETKAAVQYGAPYHQLMARRRGRPASNTRGGHNKKLSAPEDSALKDYIFMLYSAGTSANTNETQTAASRLLYYVSGDTKASISCRWTK
jgi:hypothetical protein